MAYKASSDRVLFLSTSLLTLFGLIMVYSASSVVASRARDVILLFSETAAARGHWLHPAAGSDECRLPFLQNEKVIRSLIFLSLAALVLVLMGPKINGAHRWFRYGPLISFQPSEIAKLVLLAFMAAYLHKHESEINEPWNRLCPCLLVVGLFTALIGIEPDLGQALCMVFIAAVLLYLAGLSWRYIAGAAVLALPAFYFFCCAGGIQMGSDPRFPRSVPGPAGFGMADISIVDSGGERGLWGVGLGASKQKLFFLPEASSDFIFAVIGEEIGLLGTSLIVLGFLIFFYRGMKITLRAPDRFGFYFGLGITLMVVLQGFINISMVLAMIPTKGIALPFISQGGSSLLLNLAAAGVLLNISHHAKA